MASCCAGADVLSCVQEVFPSEMQLDSKSHKEALYEFATTLASEVKIPYEFLLMPILSS